jgi:alpha-D-ribose 1-methylphosphonate 5-triphosphate diphosphatase PhnM
MARTSPKSVCVFTGTNVVLPGRENPTPGTIRVDIQSGKIIDVTEGKRTSQDFPDSDFIDVGDKYILPGLVELVIFPVHASRSSPSSAALMSILMNPGAPIGRASILEHELLSPEVSQPW